MQKLRHDSGHDIRNWRKKRRRQPNAIAWNVRMTNKKNRRICTAVGGIFLKAPMGGSLSVSSLLRSRRGSMTGMATCHFMDVKCTNEHFWPMTGERQPWTRLTKQLRHSGPPSLSSKIVVVEVVEEA